MNNKYNMDDQFNVNEDDNKKDEEIEVLDLWEPHADEITDAKDRHIKMSKKTTNKIVIILVAMGALLLMWYSTFAQPLASNNKQYQQDDGTFDVHFTNIELDESSIVGTAKEVQDPSLENNDLKANFYVSFAHAGDTIKYNLTVKNEGNINAKATGVYPDWENMTDGIIAYAVDVDYDKVLKPGDEMIISVTAKYLGGVPSGEIYKKDMSIEVYYKQA